MLCSIAWLSVVGGMSQEKCQVVRNYLLNIINLSKQVNNQHQIFQQIPKDVRTVADIQEMKLGKIRQKSHVKDYSRAFQELNNEAECTRMVNHTGIRWSELNFLHYWDPVQQIPLGIMHNWFEGILQHHFQYQWRWDFEKFAKIQAKSNNIEEDDDLKMEDGDTSGQAGLSWEQGHNMMVALSDVIVPFGVTRIPKWLRQAKEGKIKASKWCSLFSIYLPLAEIDTLVGDIEKFLNKSQEAENLCQLVDNFCSLVVCTHILEARSITKPDCIQFGQEY
ncbi:hypothetical protein O181_083618 [Austropuccinia psidii MF-1]|uniref:Uncharacterized protein n=1 Tax=Austropuccinia psidii MF-1 TaxID=1389203 RepID=A0A9Q3FPQ6_9BASI|nr:hypothetical protein [Austropuccinia psidii MF-1]